MKKLLSIVLSISMLFSMASVAFASETTVEKTIKVGINAEYPPFEYYENDKLTGFDIELMNYIGERIGYDIEYVEFPFDRLLPAVASGEVDCAISAITITKERDGVIDYTRPYLTANVTYEGEESVEEYGIVFPTNSAAKAKLIEASGDPYPSVYMLVDNAILGLKKDGSILKLIEKYELNGGSDNDENYKTTYSSTVTLEDTQSSGRPTPTIPSIPGSTSKETAITIPIPSDWAKDSVIKATDLGIMEAGKGYAFLKPITREEFCELIYNYCGNVLEMLSTADGKRFSDTNNPKIEVLSGMGIINGKTATEFAPNDALTREEATVILLRMVNATVPVEVTEMWFEFDDIDNISDWAMDAVQTMCNMNVMNGVGNNNFAPKEVYTTEQAIVTITRVYSAQTAAYRDSLANGEDIENIIGGADGPTSIIVGDNVNVIEQEDYDNFYIEVKKNTTKVNDFYVDEAIKLITESGKLAADKDFISLYTTDDEMTSQMLELGAADYSKPSAIYHLSADKEQIIANIKALADEEVAEIDLEKLLNHKKLSFAVLPSLINASYGPQNLAALTILTNSRGYVMPKDFKNDFALYFEYDGGCSALVTFSEFGDGVISANMSFVINGDKDNIFRRVFEITQGLGEDSIKIALVK